MPGDVRVRVEGLPEGRVTVWWYGPVLKQRKVPTIPLVRVFFRGEENARIERDVALTDLGLLRIGSIWENGVRVGQTNHQVETPDLSFEPGDWQIASPKSDRYALIPKDRYPLPFEEDRNNLIIFEWGDRGRLLIPCMEFFTRCYGRSAEVRRVLALYPWEEALRHLGQPIEAKPGQWGVQLSKRLYDDDAVFVAHLLHDPYAQEAARSICAQIEVAHKYAFLKVKPWFKGPARLKVAGLRLDEKTFLGLRILGCSDPPGLPILRDRENTNKVDRSSEPTPGTRVFIKSPSRPPVAGLTGALEPDRGSASLELREEPFLTLTLDRPREVIDLRRAQSRKSVQRLPGAGPTTHFSAGEAFGEGKGVGQAAIRAPVIRAGEGILLEMWRAARWLAEKNRVLSAHWYTPGRGFCSESTPELIPLTPFGEEERVSASVRNWVFLEPERPRGVLLIRVRAGEKTAYLFEIERGPKEAFRGLVFTLDQESDLETQLGTLLDRVRHEKGLVQRLAPGWPGQAHAYKHVPGKGERPYEGTVRSALGKVGIRL